MRGPQHTSRRRLLGATAGIAALGAARPLLAAGRTTDQIMGPFYPVARPLEQDADLTRVDGAAGLAEGQIVHLFGRVVDLSGAPVAGARVEIWQANAAGRYAHARDRNPAPLDPGFQGAGSQMTDAEGRYRFKTVKPGAYDVGPITRTPHIHFEVTGAKDRLVTQMYFEGEPLNENDVLLKTAFNPGTLVASFEDPTPDLEPGSRLARWNIVLGW